MRLKLITLAIVLWYSLQSKAQEAFKNLRYDEKYEYLKDSSHLSWYDRTKFLSIGNSKKYYHSFGGEIRYQYFHYTNENWGDAVADNDGYILNRLLVHSDLHLGNRFRTFVQLQNSLADGRVSPPSPVDQNELDLHQAFFDYVIGSEKSSLTLRAGRQELSYGSSRLVATREGLNNRQAFDGVKLMYNRKGFSLDGFYTDYVFSKKGIFNDEFFNQDLIFWGGYAVIDNIPFLQNVDVYYLGNRTKHATWNDVAGIETRHSLGTRIWGHTKRWTYDFEGVYQFGDIASNTIEAWTLSSNTSYALNDNKFAPIVSFKTELISGDNKSGDGKIQSFNPLFPKGAYFGYAALIGPSNLFDLHPTLTIPLNNVFVVTLDYDAFWRFSVNDGIYNPGNMRIYPAGDSGQKFIGNQTAGSLECTLNKHIYLRTGITWFNADKYLKSVGSGKDILYTGFTSTFKF